MTNIREQAGEVRNIVYSEVQDADITISQGEIKVTVAKTNTELRGNADKRLNQIRVGIKQQIKDTLGYDINVVVMLEAEKK